MITFFLALLASTLIGQAPDPQAPQTPLPQVNKKTDEGPKPPKNLVTLIQGQILNFYGAGEAGVLIELFERGDGNKEVNLGKLIASTKSVDLGDFKIEYEAKLNGEFVLRVTGAGYAPVEREVRLDPEGKPPFLDVELTGVARLQGRVVDGVSSAPVAGAIVRLSSGYREWEAKTDDGGRFSFDQLSPMSGELEVEADGYGRERQRVEIGPQGVSTAEKVKDQEAPPEGDDVSPESPAPATSAGQGNLVIKLLPERRVTIKVVDPAGKPIPTAVVECTNAQSGDYRTLFTDEQGLAEFRGLQFETRALAVKVSHAEYVQAQSENGGALLELPEVETDSVHEITLQPAARIRGRVIEVDGEAPIPGARVIIGDLFRANPPRAFTRSDGGFELTGLPTGPNFVTVHARGYAPELVEADLKPDQPSELTIRLPEPRTLHGIAVDAEGKPVGGILIRAMKWRGHETLGLQAMTGADGEFTINDAPTDEFEIMAQGPSGARAELRVGAGVKTTTVLINLQPPRELGGSGPSGTKVKVAEAAPSFNVTALDGKVYSNASLKGRYVLLDFWATWCGPCVREVPHMLEVHKRFGSRPDFVILGLSLDREKPKLEAFVKQREIAWPQVFAQEGGAVAMAEEYGVEAIPTLILVGPDGKVIAVGLRGENIVERVGAALPKNPVR